jgi:DNA-directed RNA polymerase specialized sigma24 family protein
MGHVNAHQAAVDYASSDSPPGRQLEQRDQIESFFLKLPQDAVSVLKWIYLDGLSYQQVAKKLGKPLNSLGPLLTRIRSAFRPVSAE